MSQFNKKDYASALLSRWPCDVEVSKKTLKEQDEKFLLAMDMANSTTPVLRGNEDDKGRKYCHLTI